MVGGNGSKTVRGKIVAAGWDSIIYFCFCLSSCSKTFRLSYRVGQRKSLLNCFESTVAFLSSVQNIHRSMHVYKSPSSSLFSAGPLIYGSCVKASKSWKIVLMMCHDVT